MIPLRLVIDTNVVVSAALKPEGLQRTVVLLAMTKPALWYVSDAIVSNMLWSWRVLHSRFAGICATNCCT
jgi:predicted nucleic acid-binding protein